MNTVLRAHKTGLRVQGKLTPDGEEVTGCSTVGGTWGRCWVPRQMSMQASLGCATCCVTCILGGLTRKFPKNQSDEGQP